MVAIARDDGAFAVTREGWYLPHRHVGSLDVMEKDFVAVAERFVVAAGKMKADSWWWSDANLTNKNIRRQILKEMLTRKRLR